MLCIEHVKKNNGNVSGMGYFLYHALSPKHTITKLASVTWETGTNDKYTQIEIYKVNMVTNY